MKNQMKTSDNLSVKHTSAFEGQQKKLSDNNYQVGITQGAQYLNKKMEFEKATSEINLGSLPLSFIS